MSKKQKSTRFEQHIYVENRNGALRFKVVVHPLQDSATFSKVEEGAHWARRRRLDFLEEKAAVAIEHAHPDVGQRGHGFGDVKLLPPTSATIKLSDVFDSFENFELPKLSSQATEASCLARFREWFGVTCTWR